ncbi:MAG: hypothetical protein U0136_04890 [Bdellovibrionota bacterium]
MHWRRRGHLFAPDGSASWMRHHAANPFAVHESDDVFRVYFSARDDDNRSHIGFVKLELNEAARIAAVADRPVLSPGAPGYFDDSGVSMGSIAKVGRRTLLYYLGWNLGVTVPFRNTIGAAELDAGGISAERVSRAPVLDRSAHDPLSMSYPYVIETAGKYEMFYGSTTNYGSGKSTEEMTHVVKRAESSDGVEWRTFPSPCIDVHSADELGISRPTVLRDSSGYRMWYSYRSRSGPYRIGYAESANGQTWDRKDRAVAWTGEAEEWESDMQCYCHVFRHRGTLHMLYCGNGYGKTGFGLATLVP